MRTMSARIAAIVLAATLTGTAHAAVRWGVELGPQLGSFTHEAEQNGVVLASGVPVNENRRASSFGGGVLAEWPVSRVVTWTGGLRYEESAAGFHEFVGELFNGPAAYDLFANQRLAFRALTLAPGVRVAVGAGFGVAFAPEFSYLLKATRHIEADREPPVAGSGFASAVSLGDLVGGGTKDRDVTGDYHRTLLGFGTGVSWEHALGFGVWRLSADYHRQLSEPARDAHVHEQVQDLRLTLAWLQ